MMQLDKILEEKMQKETKMVAHHATKGFSLLEIMAVLTIMAMAMGGVAVGVMSYIDKAKIKQAKMDIKNISNGLDLYKTEFNNYPEGEDGLQKLVDEKILKEKKMPKDPWGNDYIYIFPGANNTDSFDLYSFGKDGKDGGDDDIVNWDTDEE